MEMSGSIRRTRVNSRRFFVPATSNLLIAWKDGTDPRGLDVDYSSPGQFFGMALEVGFWNDLQVPPWQGGRISRLLAGTDLEAAPNQEQS
jgi:hypothetical protein